MNKTFSVEVSEENASLLKSILREEGVDYKIRPYEYFQDTNGITRRGLGTISIEHESDFLAPYRRAVKSEFAHAIRRISASNEHKDEYNWENVRENLNRKKDDMVEKILQDDEIFKGMKEAVNKKLVANLEKLNVEPKKKKKY